MADQLKTVSMYTDGGCAPNPGVGGWGCVMLFGNHRRELSGGELESTNNRMELIAAIEGLRALKQGCTVELYTDSQYLRLGVTKWMPGWKQKGWKRGKNGTVKNLDLWQALDALLPEHNIHWNWVKGHAGVPENERCDELAGEAIERIRMTGSA